MANWWAGDESSDSVDNVYTDSEDDQKEVDGMGRGGGIPYPFDSDSDEYDKRVVRSATEKRWEDLQGIIKKITNSMKINDWNAISTDWDLLLKAVAKAKSVIDQKGVPGFFIAHLVQLDDYLNAALSNKEAQKAMKPKMKKFLNSMKLKFKRFLKENEFGIEQQMKSYRENPSKFEEENAEEEEEEKSETDGKKKKEASANFWLNDEIPSDEEDLQEKSDEEDSLSDDVDPNKITREWFFQKDDEKKRVTKETRRTKKEPREPTTASTSTTTTTATADSKQVEEKKIEWTQEKVFKALSDLLKQRGTKNYDRVEALKQLQFLLSKVEGAGKQFTVRFHIINAYFDCSPSSAVFLSVRLWCQIFNEVVSIIEGLNAASTANPPVEFYETPEDLLTKYDEDDILKLPPHVAQGHLLYSIERLHEEFMKSLQSIDSHTQEFLSRLAHERDFLNLLQSAEQFYNRRGDNKRMAAIAYRELDYLYYKRTAQGGGIIEEVFIPNDDVIDDDVQPEEPPIIPEVDEVILDDVEAETEKEKEEEINLLTPKDVAPIEDLTQAVSRLCSIVYKHSTENRHKPRAMLQQIYHLSLHDRFFEARDLLLMTHLQEKITLALTSTQVMYNRTIVQLGLAAFRLGRIEDANNCLQDIVLGGRAKELLAQGISMRHQEKNEEQEKQERVRQIPYHLHINLDLIECVQLICAMLLEVVPQSRFRDTKKKVVSKHFRKILDYYDRQIFTGPPENNRDAVIVSAKFLEKGEWRKAQNTILNLEIWKLMHNREKVLEMLKTEIQIQALRTYVIVYGQYYSSLLTSKLATMFELDQSTVTAVLSKMMLNDELHASFDLGSKSVTFHSKEPSNLQYAALNFAEKLNQNVLIEVADAGDQRFERRWVDQRTTQKQQQQLQPAQKSRFANVGLRSDRQFSQQSQLPQQQTQRKQKPTGNTTPQAQTRAATGSRGQYKSN